VLAAASALGASRLVSKTGMARKGGYPSSEFNVIT
jgi:hypothetical protein